MIKRKNVEVFIDGYDETVFVNYDYYPGRAGRMYLRNGDPGYPPEDAEADVTWVSFIKDGPDLWEILSEDAQNNLQDRCMEYEDEEACE